MKLSLNYDILFQIFFHQSCTTTTLFNQKNAAGGKKKYSGGYYSNHTNRMSICYLVTIGYYSGPHDVLLKDISASSSLEPMNAALNSKRCNSVKVPEKKNGVYALLPQWVLHAITCVLSEKHKRAIQNRRWQEDRGAPQKLGEARNGSSPTVPGRNVALPTPWTWLFWRGIWTSGLQNSERINFLCFKVPTSCWFAMAVTGN